MNSADLIIVGGRRDNGSTDPLALVDGRITGAAPPGSPAGAPTLDADGLVVCPGFVDLQINGGHGLDLATDPEAMWDLGRALPRHGVTAFLPTIISSPPAITERALTAINDRPDGYTGAEPLGLHLEGPMLNPERAGAHDSRNLVPPDPEVIARWSRANGVALVTMAPELPGADRVIAQLVAGGVVVSAGHTLATATEADSAFTAGVSMVTHLFNAMGAVSHRSPGLAGAALANDRVRVGLIADGVHVDPVMVKVVWRAAGAERIVLVTDAVAAMGLGPGHYELGDQVITADEVSVRTAAGVLAGSILTMDRAVANIMAFTGCSVHEAVTSASKTPAMAIGAADRGRLIDGAVADIVLLEPDATVAATICAGELVYVADRHQGRLGDIGAVASEGAPWRW